MAHNQGDAAKAYRLRKAISTGQVLKPIDKLWLDEYEHDHPRSGDAYGASRKARKVSATFDLEEAAESVGSGDVNPATIAAAAALQSREEGRRIDALSTGAVEALKEAVSTYKSICESLQAMLETYQSHHLDTLDSVRNHYLARTQSEAALARMMEEKDNEGDPVNALMAIVAARHLGIPADQLPGVAKVAAQMGKKPGKNGPPPK
jgi:hypothetical protein